MSHLLLRAETQAPPRIPAATTPSCAAAGVPAGVEGGKRGVRSVPRQEARAAGGGGHFQTGIDRHANLQLTLT